jgi:hypothetical protein
MPLCSLGRPETAELGKREKSQLATLSKVTTSFLWVHHV